MQVGLSIKSIYKHIWGVGGGPKQETAYGAEAQRRGGAEEDKTSQNRRDAGEWEESKAGNEPVTKHRAYILKQSESERRF